MANARRAVVEDWQKVSPGRFSLRRIYYNLRLRIAAEAPFQNLAIDCALEALGAANIDEISELDLL